jgi:hypothetical protein
MNEFITTLAEKAGLDNLTAEKGLGALLTAIQGNVPNDTFTKISAAIPDAGGILSSFQKIEKAPSDGASLLDLAGGILGKNTGALGGLVSQFSKAGFSVDTVKAFIPVVLTLLKDRLSPDLMKQIDSALPGVSTFMTPEKASLNPLEALKKLF